jgi:hypothetical protein
MDSGTASFILVVLGALGLFFGLSSANVIQQSFLYVGINWLIGGMVYWFVNKAVSRKGFLVGLLFGGAGAILWLILHID